MKRTPAELRGLLARHDKAVRLLALGLRTIVLEELAPCHEL
jgi:hypothetical protein